MNWFLNAERAIMLFFQNIRSEPFDSIMIFISSLGDRGAIWIIICLALICTKRFRKAGIIGLLSLAFCFLINNLIIKNIVQRPRPFYTIEELSIIVSIPSEFSFPSGHSSSSFAAANGIFLASKNRKFSALFILATLIAISRVYVGVHYLSDILAGAIVGILSSWIVYRISLKLKSFSQF